MPELVENRPHKAEAEPVSRLLSYRTVGKITGIIDYTTIVGTSIAAGIAYHSLVLGSRVPDIMSYIGIGNITAALFILLVAAHSGYRTSSLKSFTKQAKVVILAWVIALLCITMFMFLVKVGAHVSRGTIISFGVLCLGLLLGLRFLISTALKEALARGTLAGDRAILIGERDALSKLSHIDILRKCGAREVSRFVLPPITMRNSEGNSERAFAVIEKAIQAARLTPVDCVLLALQWSDEQRRNLICEHLQALPIPVILLPDQQLDSILSRARNIGPEFTVEIQRGPLSASELTIKRALDLVLAGTLMVALIPLFALVALLIRLDSPGPVVFRQRRSGFNGREFTIYKFRTMKVLEDGSLICQARRNDIRVTRVGRILRATSIDELPQLINVLGGQMSLVGPRPHAVAHDDGYGKVIANYAYRQHVKPGLTGWAQVNGLRGETARLELMEKRVALDLWYVKNWNIWLDLQIIIRTCFVILRSSDAY